MKKDMKIWVTFQRKGYHFYPDPPEEVLYLKSRHRHLFKFRVEIQVFHDDREIEFHMFQNKIESWYDSGILELNHKSCEMMADELYQGIKEEYQSREIPAKKQRDLTIEVSEDGECGAIGSYRI